MIVTVTLNPAVDKTLVIHAFRPGVTNRATVDRVEMGGKGINVARTLKRLECHVIATGLIGADAHEATTAMLAHDGIDADFVPVVGETRVNLKVIDPLAAVETEINEPGFAVPADVIAMLAIKLRTLARKASVVVLSGSLPPGVPANLYAQLVSIARAEGAHTLLDTAGAALAHGLAAGPDLAKPNRAEAEELVDAPIRSEESLVAAADRILAMGARSVVISLGPDGALSASLDSGFWRARPPAITARSTIGAGDAMVAALAYGLMRSLPPQDALRLATAASCAAAGTVERHPVWSEIQTLVPCIVVEASPLAPIDATRGPR